MEQVPVLELSPGQPSDPASPYKHFLVWTRVPSPQVAEQA